MFSGDGENEMQYVDCETLSRPWTIKNLNRVSQLIFINFVNVVLVNSLCCGVYNKRKSTRLVDIICDWRTQWYSKTETPMLHHIIYADYNLSL